MGCCPSSVAAELVAENAFRKPLLDPRAPLFPAQEKKKKSNRPNPMDDPIETWATPSYSPPAPISCHSDNVATSAPLGSNQSRGAKTKRQDPQSSSVSSARSLGGANRVPPPSLPSISSTSTATATASTEKKETPKEINSTSPPKEAFITPPPPTQVVDGTTITTSGLKVVEAPRPAEHVNKEEEFEFYKKKMEQLNREKENTNARFQEEEKKKQEEEKKRQEEEKKKQEEEKKRQKLEKASKKPSLRKFFRGNEEEEEAEGSFAIGAPQGFKHEGHIGWSPEGGFDMVNIPNEWRQLLEKAGVTEEQMKDKEIAMFIVSFVTKHLGTRASVRQSKEPKKQEEAQLTPQGGQAVPMAPAAPQAPAPAVPVAPAAPVAPAPVVQLAPAAPTAPEAPVVPTAPAAPAAPEAPPMQPPQHGAAPPPPPMAPPTASGESSGDLFSAIRGGVSLKKVKALPDVTNLSAEEEDSIAGALARALETRRFALKEEDEEEDSDNGDWDD
jgi:hypothetical protein